MNSTDRIPEKQVDAGSAAPSRAAHHANAADFRAALADAHRTAGPADGHPPGIDRGGHVVKAGETLYGIARARLAAAGQPATPGASMRYALQIAKANQIRNPDRIHPGQQLQLDQVTATFDGRNDVATALTRSFPRAEGAAALRLHEPDGQHRMTATDSPADAGDNVSDTAEVSASNPAQPAVGRIAADTHAVRSLPDRVATARVDLSLYQQVAHAAAPKPPVELADVVYKGMVGKALDLVPLDPSTRTGLQQASAVISSSLAGRSIAALTGLGGPLLTVAGLIWGIFAAHKISASHSGAPDKVARTPTAEIVK